MVRKTVLVTGATGYIGGRLIEHWLQQGSYNVIALTRKPHLALFGGCQAYKTVVGDLKIMSDRELLTMCKDVDCVVNLVGAAAKDCQDRPLVGLETNAGSTIRIARAAKAAGVARLIQMSTIHVYGDLYGRVLDENTCPQPVHSYGIAHLAAEQFARIEATSEFVVSIVRLSNAFGRPHHSDVQCWTLAANDLCRQAIEKHQLHVRSSGFQYRDFIPMSNVCSAVTKIIEDNSQRSQVLQLGSGQCLTIRELTQAIEGRFSILFGGSLQSLFASEERGGNESRFDYRIDRIRTLGYNEIVSIAEELDDCLRFCLQEFRST